MACLFSNVGVKVQMSQVVSSESAQAMPVARPLRKECPPGACDCQREALLECLHAPEARVLWLTREEEKRLIERITRVTTYDELLHVGSLMRKNLGIHLHISPGPNEVRTVRGLDRLPDRDQDRIGTAGQHGAARRPHRRGHKL